MAVTKEKLGAGRKSGVETPPEGGWGWMIVAGCFLATICTRAVTRCVSMFLVEFQLHFEKDYSTIAWIHSLMDSVTMLCAPLGGFLGGRLSCRVTVMLGGLLSATGLVISSFVSSPECLYVFMGILTGLGFALSYTPALAMVGRYFSERKALAYGIALSGTGIGTFILAPVVHLLIEHYSWRGALLILGGFVSNLCVCGALMKPLETRGEKEHLSENYMTDKDQDCMTTVLDSKDTELAPADGSSVEPKQLETDNLKDTQQILISSGALRNTGLENDKLSEGNIALLTDLTLVESLFFTNRRTGTVLEEIKRSECKPAGGSTGKDMRLLENVILNKSADKDALTDEPQLTEATDSFQLTVIRPPGPFISTKTSSRCPFSCLLNPGQEFGFLLIPDFLVLSVSFLFMGYGCSAPAVYLVPYAVSVGVEHQHAAFLMSIFGVSVIVGNITFGLITDRSCLKRYRMVCYMLLIAIEGFWCMFLPLLQSFPLLASFSVLYGYIEGAYVALIPVVTSDVVGPTYLTSALGVVYFLHGIPYLISPPIGGWLVDRTGNYMATFFLSGVCFMLSSVVLITTMLVRHYQRSKCISASQFGPSGAAAAAQQGI